MAGTTARAASSAKAPADAPGRALARSRDSELASAVKALVVAGQRDRARERFGELVACQQRRAVRIAFHYLRDAHDADEAVQDAFLKVFTHITTYRDRSEERRVGKECSSRVSPKDGIINHHTGR